MRASRVSPRAKGHRHIRTRVLRVPPPSFALFRLRDAAVMTNAESASTPRRRREWRRPAVLAPSPARRSTTSSVVGPFARPSLLAKFRASFLRLDAGDTDTESMECDDDGPMDQLSPSALDADEDQHKQLQAARDVDMEDELARPRSLVRALPAELLALSLSHLDGRSLLRCAAACRSLRALTYDRDVWRRLCLARWPSLAAQTLPQLPGAPDYDVIRLYGGSWRRCFTEQHSRDQRAEVAVAIPQFAREDMGGVEKIVSDTFAIGSHRFCLWIFPNGNPNEPQYAGAVLSVYLVLTDLEQRPPDWLTCAVFSLAVRNHADPKDAIEWHSCLVDNKFDRSLNNWGVHALGALETLKDPRRGFLGPHDTLTVSASVRLMSITFRVVLESDLKAHHDLGLVDLARVDAVVLPFCCSLHDLLLRLHELYDVAPEHARVWCFNQPVVSGQALRPRKLLTAPHVDRRQPMFGHLLCDGVDIDAYSFCQIYVEDTRVDDPPMNVPASAVSDHLAALPAPTTSKENVRSSTETAVAAEEDSSGYVFVKVLDPRTRQLEFLGRVFFSSAKALSSAMLYDAAAARCSCTPADLVMFKEEIAPLVLSAPVPFSYEPMAAALSSRQASKSGDAVTLAAADIVVFAARGLVDESAEAVRALLLSHYAVAQRLVTEFDVGSDGEAAAFHPPPTLADVEELAEKLDIPKFRVRSAFRKCREDARATLRYIMDGRHLGFICDSCGETDFRGARFNCAECSDYDLCAACHGESSRSNTCCLGDGQRRLTCASMDDAVHCQEVTHRYANVDGKWQRVYDFQDHKPSHAMREMLPVFFQRPVAEANTLGTWR